MVRRWIAGIRIDFISQHSCCCQSPEAEADGEGWDGVECVEGRQGREWERRRWRRCHRCRGPRRRRRGHYRRGHHRERHFLQGRLLLHYLHRLLWRCPVRRLLDWEGSGGDRRDEDNGGDRHSSHHHQRLGRRRGLLLLCLIYILPRQVHRLHHLRLQGRARHSLPPPLPAAADAAADNCLVD